jgi:hypothetical protein
LSVLAHTNSVLITASETVDEFVLDMAAAYTASSTFSALMNLD